MKNNTYAMIMAGGGGTRLWPLSRRTRPKQSLPLVTQDSMFRTSVMRLLPLIPIERIYVVTGADQVERLREDVPELPSENFVVEPSARDNGPAAALGIANIHAKDPNATIAYLASDHHIMDEAGFLKALEAAFETAQQDYIVTLGISPTFPSTGFGYIKSGDHLNDIDDLPIHQSAGFREKPDAKTALEFVSSGNYFWNAGMFIWKSEQALREFETQQPIMYKNLTLLMDAINGGNYQETLDQVWEKMPKIAIDYAIMENAERMAMIPVSIGWSDIGSWSALYEVLSEIEDIGELGNIKHGSGDVLNVDSKGTLVHSDKLVVTIGLEDVVIVETDDAIMVCHRDHAQSVKEAVQQLRAEGRDTML